MEFAYDSPEMLENLMCPAFTVNDGMIVHTNRAAAQHQIQPGTPVADIIGIGNDAYAAFTNGKLCLTVNIEGLPYQATVSNVGKMHLFCLESDYDEPELRAFALAAQQLREPLANAMASTDMLLPTDKGSEQMRHIAQINRSLHQLLRAVSNMSDAANYAKNQMVRMETHDATAIFNEILEKAASHAAQAGRTICYQAVQKPAVCLIDAERIERAVWNMLSNAMKYSPVESHIYAELRLTEKHLSFSVWDSGKHDSNLPLGDMFHRFLRQPGVEDGRFGIGLGLSIIRSAAAAHNGTVLLEQTEGNGVKATMTIKLQRSQKNSFSSPVLLPIDYAGGRDHCLLELSDSLPSSMYDSNI